MTINCLDEKWKRSEWRGHRKKKRKKIRIDPKNLFHLSASLDSIFTKSTNIEFR